MTEGRNAPGPVVQAVFLFAAAAVLGLLVQLFSPTRIPWRQDWSRYVESRALEVGLALATLDDVRNMVEKNTHLLLDARPMADYDRGHLPGALALPHAELDTYYPQIAPLLTPEQPVVVYCSGLECDESFLLSVYLREQGFTNVALFAGGLSAWRAAGLPVEGP